MTLGKFATQAELHSLTKVPGHVDFTLDIRSQDIAVLDGMEACLRAAMAEIGGRRGGLALNCDGDADLAHAELVALSSDKA